jgi:hypothetical protein
MRLSSIENKGQPLLTQEQYNGQPTHHITFKHQNINPSQAHISSTPLRSIIFTSRRQLKQIDNMPVPQCPDTLRSTLSLATTIGLGISIAFSTFLGVMIFLRISKAGCSPGEQRGLATALLVFLAITAVLQIIGLVGARMSSSENNFTTKTLKALRPAVKVSAVMTYAFAATLSALAMLDHCSYRERHALAFTTLLFLGMTMASGIFSFLLNMFPRKAGRNAVVIALAE